MVDNLKPIIEALLFASEKPLAVNQIQKIIGAPMPSDAGRPDSHRGVSAKTDDIKNCLQELKQSYDANGNAFTVFEIAGGYQLRTRTDFQPYLIKLKETRQEGTLSNAALETLSIIAYKQPIGRAEVEAIRGVDSSAIVRGLMDKKLIRITGRGDALGRPILYGTTNNFLELLGLSSIKDLLKPVELAPATEPQMNADKH
ncbi:MAG: SMC-Scp complex subunit ScpB [Planctomycetes bacterium]|nr:SMC-Scp complex subunit ScpB [Planctomycetota bacterium]